MEYLIVLILELIGISLHVMEKVAVFDKKYPECSINQIFKVFWRQDWNTVIISVIVLCLNLMIHLIINWYAPELTTIKYYLLYAFGGALLLGYGGQRFVYRSLGTAEKFLDNKVNGITA